MWNNLVKVNTAEKRTIQYKVTQNTHKNIIIKKKAKRENE